MITIFSLPKPFIDRDVKIIQNNAISSWKNLGQDVETFIIGGEEGIALACQNIGVRHIKDVRRSEFGTPFLNDAFRIAEKESSEEVLVYSNADIIFFKDLLEAIKKLPSDKFLAVGRRTDLDIDYPVSFENRSEKESLRKKAEKEGSLHSPAGIDYFIFRKSTINNMPPLVVGRIGWDNYMIWNAKKNNIPIIDLTKDVLAIHQNHKPAPQNESARKTNPEALHNIFFIEGRGNSATIEDANYKMVNGKLVKNHLHFLPKFKRIIKSYLKI